MKVKKQLLSRLMALDNKEADKQLADFANDIKNTIQQSSDNDEVFDQLELLEEFIYKVPAIAIEIIRYILANPLELKVTKTDFGDLPGKPPKDILLKCIKLLDRLRYIAIDDVMSIAKELLLQDDADVKARTSEILKHLAQYDYTLLSKTKLGYSVQRKILDYIQAWSPEEKLNNFEFIEVVTQELLGSSVEGTSAETFDTLTFHRGAVQPTQFLKELRKETMDLVFDMYKRTVEPSKKLKLVRVLEEAVRAPSSVAYGDDVSQMIAEAGSQLTSIYRQMIFDDKNQLTGPLAVVEEVDKRLYWQQKHNSLMSLEADQLRKDILNNKLYKLTRLLVGDDIVYREEQGWDDADQKRDTEIADQIKTINRNNIDQWIQDITTIASEKGVINEWQYAPFRIFIKKLASDKSELAEKMLIHAFDHHSPLLDFLDSFLSSFRSRNRLDLWDSFVRRTLNEQNPVLVCAIPYSLLAGNNEPIIELRLKDMRLLKKMVTQKAEFSFLKSQNEKNYALHHAIINVLINQYPAHPKIMEQLIVIEIKSYPDYDATHLHALSFNIHSKDLNFDEWSETSLGELKKMLIRFADIDWHAQEILVMLGKLNIEYIFDIFAARIKHDGKEKSKRKSFVDTYNYRAIPYDFNPDLQNFIRTHPKTLTILQDWLGRTTTKWSAYNWELGHLIERVGISLQDIVKPLIQAGDNASLKKAVYLMDPFNGVDIELCMEIVAKTDNKEIVSHLQGQFFTTGVVSGKYGIAEAHEKKAQELEKFSNSENPRIKKFAIKLIEDLRQSAAQERIRSDEQEKLRKINFED